MPEDTDPQQPTQPTGEPLLPGQLRILTGPEGFVVHSVNVVHIRPDDFRRAVKGWILEQCPELIAELAHEQIARIAAQQPVRIVKPNGRALKAVKASKNG